MPDRSEALPRRIALWIVLLAAPWALGGCESCGFSLPVRSIVLRPQTFVEPIEVEVCEEGREGAPCRPAEGLRRVDAAFELAQRADGGLVGRCGYPAVTLKAKSQACVYEDVDVPGASEATTVRVDLVCRRAVATAARPAYDPTP
jgi:hypothetical protein